jgi:hypothetical protein
VGGGGHLSSNFTPSVVSNLPVYTQVSGLCVVLTAGLHNLISKCLAVGPFDSLNPYV